MKNIYFITLLSGLATLLACKPTTQSTIDDTLQAKVDSIMNSQMVKYSATAGQAIVMDIQTGEIKAMTGNAPKQESSLVCTIYLDEALRAGKVNWSDTIDVGDGICIIDGDTVKDHNWTRGGYGKLTLKDGFVRNSEIAVRKAMKTAGVEFEHQQLAPTDVLQAYNEIIRDGSLNQVLRYSITDGLGMRAKSDLVEVAGLPGTCDLGNDTYAMEFCGYYPADAPKYSIIVCMNKKNYPASGAFMAGTTFRMIVDAMVEAGWK